MSATPHIHTFFALGGKRFCRSCLGVSTDVITGEELQAALDAPDTVEIVIPPGVTIVVPAVNPAPG